MKSIAVKRRVEIKEGIYLPRPIREMESRIGTVYEVLGEGRMYGVRFPDYPHTVDYLRRELRVLPDLKPADMGMVVGQDYQDTKGVWWRFLRFDPKRSARKWNFSKLRGQSEWKGKPFLRTLIGR